MGALDVLSCDFGTGVSHGNSAGWYQSHCWVEAATQMGQKARGADLPGAMCMLAEKAGCP